MPNGVIHKEYGKHDYGEHEGTNDCKYGCGCWVGPFNSGGPLGLDPFGTCPKNPTDHVLLGGDQDYEYVVKERIRKLEAKVLDGDAELQKANDKLKMVEPDKKVLAEELAETKEKLKKAYAILDYIRDKVKITFN